jgi:hypothetical protein
MLVPHGSWALYSPLVKQKGKRHAHHNERPHQQKGVLVKIKKHDEKLKKNKNTRGGLKNFWKKGGHHKN